MELLSITKLLEMPVFWFAEEYPNLSEKEEKELAQDLELNGQEYPIWIYNGTILDGRNRLRALKGTLLTEAKVAYFEGTEDQAMDKIHTLNGLRRHMTVSQVSLIAEARLKYEEGKARVRQQEAGGDKVSVEARALEAATASSGPMERAPQSRDIIAEKYSVSGRSIQDAKRIRLNAPDLVAGIKAGELSLDAATKQLKIREEELDKKLRMLEFEASDLWQQYQKGQLALDDAYSELIKRQNKKLRERQASSNEALDLISTYSSISEERLHEFTAKMQKLSTVEKVDKALSYVEAVDTKLKTTKTALLRLRDLLEEESS